MYNGSRLTAHGSRLTAHGSRRDSVADSLRGLAIILVVVGHVIKGFNHSKLTFVGSSLIDAVIYSFHMPLMFMISGYVSAMKNNSSSTRSRLVKCAVSLYLPCLYFSFLLWLPKFFWSFLGMSNAENFTLASVSDFLKIPVRGFDLYWFLCTLFFVKAIHILTESFIPSAKLHALFWLLLFVGNYTFGIHSFGYYGLYFHAGYVMKSQNITTREKHPGASCGTIIFLCGISFFAASYFFGAENIFTKTGAALCMSLGVFILFYAGNIGSNFLAEYGAASMVTYVLHNSVISTLRLFFRRLGLSSSVNPAILFVFCCIMSLAIPIGIVKMYKNVKCLRWVEYIFYPGKFLRRNPS